jgi:hypothetical protein
MDLRRGDQLEGRLLAQRNQATKVIDIAIGQND